jgi:hypothetical protein
MEQPSPTVGLDKLRQVTESDDAYDLEELLNLYKAEEPQHPVLSLVDDIQMLAALYWNVVEELKRDAKPADIKNRYARLNLLVTESWPNPNWSGLLERALNKLAKLRGALITTIQKFGGKLLGELSLETGLTVGLAVNLGLPPSVSFSVEHESKAVVQAQWVPARQEPTAE